MTAFFRENAIAARTFPKAPPSHLMVCDGKIGKHDDTFAETAVRKEDTTEKIRALSKAQLAQSEFDIRSYHFITETGTFTAYLDLKIWGKRCLECFFTFADGRKIVACTFPEADYLGLADIPIGTNLRLTFEETVRSKRIYLRKAEAVL